MRNMNYLKEQGIDIEKSLELFGDIDKYNSSIGEFIVGVSEKVNKMNEYRLTRDLNNLVLYAHSLKGDCNNFGFTSLANLALDIETKGKSGDLFYINEHFNDLVVETNKDIGIIREYMTGSDNNITANPNTNQTPVSEEKIIGEVYTKKTILVVDDSNIIRNFVKRIFEDKYGVGTAKDGEEAINIIKANQNNDYIETILLDLNMPKVDGFAVLDYMRENDLFEKIPVSIISGDSTKETIDKAFTYNIVDMLSKPFNETDIKNIIEKTMFRKNV